MTTPTITLIVKQAPSGNFEIEVSHQTNSGEPKIVEMPYTCMPGGRRKNRGRIQLQRQVLRLVGRHSWNVSATAGHHNRPWSGAMCTAT